MYLGLCNKLHYYYYYYTSQDTKKSANRSTLDALAMYLMKLRTNLSQEALGILFGYSSQSRVSTTIKSVALSLNTRFTQQFIGFNHLNREGFLSHQMKFLNRILDLPDNAVIVISDGTYFYSQKPSGYLCI